MAARRRLGQVEVKSNLLRSLAKKNSTTPNECPHPGGTEVHAVRESPLSISEQVCRLRLPRTCDLTAGGCKEATSRREKREEGSRDETLKEKRTKTAARAALMRQTA